MRIARPGGGGNRMQAPADVAAEQRGELVDGKGCERRLAFLLEVAGERTMLKRHMNITNTTRL
jgi:hypothetical protein